MNISEYIQICSVSLRIHIQTWPNIMITIGSGEDLVPEQENEVEEQQRARTAGSGEKMALFCPVTYIFSHYHLCLHYHYLLYHNPHKGWQPRADAANEKEPKPRSYRRW